MTIPFTDQERAKAFAELNVIHGLLIGSYIKFGLPRPQAVKAVRDRYPQFERILLEVNLEQNRKTMPMLINPQPPKTDSE